MIFIWDANLAIDPDYRDEDPDNSVLIRKFDLPKRETFLHAHMDLRRIVIGKVGGVEALDFWNSCPNKV